MITFAQRVDKLVARSIENIKLLMKLAAANTKLEGIIKNVEKDGVKAKNLVEDLKELRAYALQEQDPLVTKVLRLSLIHI